MLLSESEDAKREYKEAYESGDSDAVLEAQEKLTNAKLKADRLANFKLPALQEPETPVEQKQNNPLRQYKLMPSRRLGKRQFVVWKR